MVLASHIGTYLQLAANCNGGLPSTNGGRVSEYQLVIYWTDIYIPGHGRANKLKNPL